ncbi:hypothetical protein R6Q59_020578 [Mikania micrantha]|uniref:DUF1645 domain-containing protein n=1 Tax=Mikania micrantha TaxID=192012 RepID=A0A5N6PQN8_9ASTR|nr:hypothetical protein E3N88_06421 [Mikania micrantha]
MEETETCSKDGSKNPHRQISGNLQPPTFSDDIDTTASTPYVSAPSSPGDRPVHSYGGGFFYSAPASPVHHSVASTTLEHAGGSFEFELSGEPTPSDSMISADELFLNGQIRPMKLLFHLQRPQDLAPLTNIAINDHGEDDGDEDRKFGRGRAFQARDRRRKARSMSPLRRNTAFQWLEEFKDGRESTEIDEIKEKLEEEEEEEDKHDHEFETPSSGATSRSSSVGRSSRRWVFLKELLYRSKSEGRNRNNSNRNHKFWSTLSFSPSSGKKPLESPAEEGGGGKTTAKKAVNGVGVNRKRRVGRSPSAHEVHYTWNRAQTEEMKKKTYLPYRQGLLGCLGFSSKSYGAVNGFARAFNPVSSL